MQVFICRIYFNPAMLLVDTNALQVIQIVITSLAGLFGVAAALSN